MGERSLNLRQCTLSCQFSGGPVGLILEVAPTTREILSERLRVGALSEGRSNGDREYEFLLSNEFSPPIDVLVCNGLGA